MDRTNPDLKRSCLSLVSSLKAIQPDSCTYIQFARSLENRKKLKRYLKMSHQGHHPRIRSVFTECGITVDTLTQIDYILQYTYNRLLYKTSMYSREMINLEVSKVAPQVPQCILSKGELKINPAYIDSVVRGTKDRNPYISIYEKCYKLLRKESNPWAFLDVEEAKLMCDNLNAVDAEFLSRQQAGYSTYRRYKHYEKSV